ncbi:MAG: M28 family peptidase, partial [Chloroflexota bacterium]
ECVSIANQLGYNMTTTNFPLLAGGTDAAEFAKAGVEATTLAAMDWISKGDDTVYHTLRDTVDAVDPIAVEQSIAVGIAYINEKEQQILQ